MLFWAFLVAQMVKNLPAVWETWVRSLVGKIPWRRAWQPTPVFLPGESHGLRTLAGYGPWGRRESDTTERLSTSASFKLWPSSRLTADCDVDVVMSRNSILRYLQELMNGYDFCWRYKYPCLLLWLAVCILFS